MNKKLDPQLLLFAKSMRHTATDAENLMWQLLRAKWFMNLKFRLQHVIKPYIVDFTVMTLVWSLSWMVVNMVRMMQLNMMLNVLSF